jgi:hypothetical protein
VPKAAFPGLSLAIGILIFASALPGSARATAQESASQPSAEQEQTERDQISMEEEKLPPGDWAVGLIDKLANSPNADARDALYRAVVAAGPEIVPQLETALHDDRTAEFAAQALAYIGGEKSLQILSSLVSDPRDLNLRRIYFGALAEFDTPEVTAALLELIKRADEEPDRTVTEAAILALTVRSDPKLLAPLHEAEKNTQDVVIRLDLENAAEVIERRSKYLTSPGRKPGGSIEQAVRTYFAPALDPAPPPEVAAPAPKASSPRAAISKPTARYIPPPRPLVDVRILNIVLSPDKGRALARVVFEDPSAAANYDIVLQKRFGDWGVASVWLGAEMEKALPQPAKTASDIK